MLFLISTPIGNLQDITPRALETLQNCTYVLCEDTRRTRILLNHYSIKVPLKSFHLFNEASKEDLVVNDLQNGLQIGLVSDAGTPGISDPGERLVKRCQEEEIQVVPIPGPCAAIAALSASGLTTKQFQFLGFLPKKKGKLRKALNSILTYSGTSICYESPFRIVSTLKLLVEINPLTECVVARELTKKFESIKKGSAQTLHEFYSISKPKGEIVLLISGIEL